jgi:hypothetical protein
MAINEVTTMDAKTAVDLAKQHIADLFSKENVSNLGLEEVDYDEAREQWRINIGFSRPWDNSAVGTMIGALRRTYKVVTLDKDGKAISVKNREPANAG